MLKKILVAIVLLIAAAAVYLHFNLDHIVKVAIEKYGTAAVQTEVRVSSVRLSPTSGEGSLSGLTVANPKGFSSAKALTLGRISVTLDTASLRGDGPIVIRTLIIEQPQVNFEGTETGDTNLQTLAHNLSGAGGGAAASQPQEPGRKLIINDLYIRDGQVSISHPQMQKPLTAEMPGIHLTNIGKSSNGATPAQVADQLLGSIINNAARIAAQKLLAAKIKGAIGNSGGAIGKTLNNLLR